MSEEKHASSVALLRKHMPPMPGPKPQSDRDIRAVKDWWYSASKRSAWHSAIMLLERGDGGTASAEGESPVAEGHASKGNPA